MLSGIIARVRSLWRGLRRRSDVEADMREEFRLHVELRTQDLIRSGLSAPEAARRARCEFGSPERYKEEARGSRGLHRLDALRFSWLDFRLGLRMLAKYPGLTVVGGLAIAFAIWAGALGFELVARVFDPKLALDEGHRVVALANWDAAASGIRDPTLGDFALWRVELKSVVELGAFRRLQRNLMGQDRRAEPVAVAEVSTSAFRVARVRPFLGRPLVADDEAPGAAPVVVIAYDVWRNRFAGDTNIVGRSVRLGRTVATIVGVMPEGFWFPAGVSFWVPLRRSAWSFQPGHGPAVRVFGRLADGESLAEARAELTAVGMRAAAEFSETYADLRPQMLPYARSFASREGLPPHVIMPINLFLILLVVLVCGNVALLMFARAATRESEMVVRNALGASRGRIIGQLFGEALVLASLAAAIGLIAADFCLRWGFGIFEAPGTEAAPAFWDRTGLTAMTVLYAGALTALAAMIAGVVPALKVTRGLGARLRQAGPGGGGFRFGGLWTGVVVAQVAAMVAFPVVAFFVRGGTADGRVVDLGFATEAFLSARLEMDREIEAGANSDAARDAYHTRFEAMYGELERRVEAEPGVIGVTFSDGPPLISRDVTRQIEIDDGVAAPADSTTQHPRVTSASIGLDYLDLLNAPILAGRAFHSGDVESDAPVVIVNQSFVQRVVGGLNPIGRRLRYVRAREPGGPVVEPAPWHEIIGVVRDIGKRAGDPHPGRPGMYHPFAPRDAMPAFLAVHTNGNPESFAPRFRSIAAEIDPALRLHAMASLDEVLRFDVDLWRFTVLFWLISVVSAGAMLVSLAGIYSVLSFTVAQRTREIGIRLALGGEARGVAATIATRPLAQVGLGILMGSGVTVSMVQMMDEGLSAIGAARVLAYVAVMIAVCTLACIVPMRRALAVEPTEALNADR